VAPNKGMKLINPRILEEAGTFGLRHRVGFRSSCPVLGGHRFDLTEDGEVTFARA